MLPGIIDRIDASHLRTYEIRIVQNVRWIGYLAWWRQDRVKAFGLVAYEALAIVKRHYEGKGESVYMPAIVGSNGGFMLTETLPTLKDNPIDAAVLVDARAYASKTAESSNCLEENSRSSIPRAMHPRCRMNGG